MKKAILSMLLTLGLTISSHAQVKPYMSEGPSPTKEARQGSCAYGNYFFQFHNSNATIEIFNLQTKQKLQTIEQTPVTAQHCNTVCFGTQKWNKGNRFPVLYVSTERDQKILVYRILGDDGQFNIQTVQTIYLPTCDAMGVYFPNPAIDGKGNKLWLTGFNLNSWKKSDGGNHIRYIQLPLPDLKGGDVTLDLNKKISEFTLPFTYATQGLVFHKGKIIQAYGASNNTNIVRVLNPKTGKVEKEFYPHKFGMDEEPEGTFIYKNKPMISSVQGNLFFVDQFK